MREWAEKFGRHFANEIRRRSAGRLGDKWYLDEVVVSVAGKKCWLWRAVDQEGFVIDVLVQSRRNAKAATRLMRKLLKTQGRAPRVMITDKLRSYDAAKRQIMPGGEFAPADPTTGEDHETLQIDATASFPVTTSHRPTTAICDTPPWRRGAKSQGSTPSETQLHGRLCARSSITLQCQAMVTWEP